MARSQVSSYITVLPVCAPLSEAGDRTQTR